MDPTPAEPPPGCLVLLLNLSAGMTADVVTGRGESVAFAAARQLADELLEGLVNTVVGGYAVGAIDVAVLGYHTAEDGSPQLLSLLPDGDPKPRLVPLVQIAELPAEARAGEGLPRKWAVLPPCTGEPCAADAMARIYQMVSVWLTGRFTGRPPVVIHCTSTDGLDEPYYRTARSLGLLVTGYGPVRLMHYVFDATNDEVSYLRLLEVSGELPDNPDAGKVARRGLSINDWDITDQWDAVFSCTWREDEVAWLEAGTAFNYRAMWAQKMGNTPDQWEDAFVIDAAHGAAAVADGASTGIYCRIWADQLSQRFLLDRPDTRDPVSLNKWVNGLRTEWRSAIDYGNLNWSKQAKVDQVGAAATFLGLELGPVEADGHRWWRACAVGDASLFWVRDGKLHATFPVVAADQFGSAPMLIRSNPGFRTLALAATGVCAPGDRFVLATDAVAARLFKSSASGPGPEWDRFETMTEDAWRTELDTLRRANDMVNDDCTLVVLCVGEGVEPTEEDPLTRHRDASRGTVPSPLDAHGGAEGEVVNQLETLEGAAQRAASQPELLNGTAEVAEGREAEEVGEGASTQDNPETSAQNQHEADGSSVPPPEHEDFAVASDVGDLMIDIPHDPPAQETQGVDAPRSPEPKRDEPADEPPAARDGFPESTDPRV